MKGFILDAGRNGWCLILGSWCPAGTTCVQQFASRFANYCAEQQANILAEFSGPSRLNCQHLAGCTYLFFPRMLPSHQRTFAANSCCCYRSVNNHHQALGCLLIKLPALSFPGEDLSGVGTTAAQRIFQKASLPCLVSWLWQAILRKLKSSCPLSRASLQRWRCVWKLHGWQLRFPIMYDTGGWKTRNVRTIYSRPCE